MLVFIVIAGFFVFFLIGVASSLVFFPIGLSDMLGGLDINNPDLIPVLKNLQIWQSIGIFVVPSYIIAWLASQNPMKFLGLARQINPMGILWVIIILMVSMPAMNQLIIWNEGMSLPGFMEGIEEWMKEREDTAAELTTSFLSADNIWGFAVNILMVAIIPAFGEEFFFRGVLQKLFGKWFKNTHLAVILASVLFSALHFQFFGFLPRLVLGLIFGYLFVWSGNLWYPILAHLFNNLLPVVVFYIKGEEAMEGQLETLGTGDLNILWTIGSILLAGLALYQFKKLSSQNTQLNTSL